MAQYWASIAADVKRALDSEGFDCVLAKRTQNKLTPKDANADTVQNHTVRVVDTGFHVRYGADMVNRRVRTLLMSADVVPTMKDSVTIGGVLHKIDDVNQISPAGVAVLYKVDLKG